MKGSSSRDSKGFVRRYMWLVVGAGAVASLFALYWAPRSQLGLQFALLTLVTLAIGSRNVVNFSRFESAVSISDIFIFLAVLLFDGEAAVLLAALEGFCSSLRITKKPLTMLFNSASMACSTSVTVWALRFCFGPILQVSRSGVSPGLIKMTCAMALLQYAFNSGIVAVAGALRVNQPIWSTWKKHYVWTSITYLAGACAAALTIQLISVVGFYAFIAMMPIVAVVYLTYTTYVKNVESSAMQAEQAKRHLGEMQESEERFRSAFDHAPIGMALVTPEGGWLQVNQCLSDIVGYTESELKGMTFQAITQPDDLGEFLGHVADVLEGKTLTHQMEK